MKNWKTWLLGALGLGVVGGGWYYFKNVKPTTDATKRMLDSRLTAASQQLLAYFAKPTPGQGQSLMQTWQIAYNLAKSPSPKLREDGTLDAATRQAFRDVTGYLIPLPGQTATSGAHG